MRSGTGGGVVDAKVAHASGERSRQDEESRTFADTDEALFDRLLGAAAATPGAPTAEYVVNARSMRAEPRCRTALPDRRVCLWVRRS